MKEMQIRLQSFQDVRDLTALAATVLFRVFITDGRRTVNAKSMMRLFSLNLYQPLTLLLDCGEEDFEVFRAMVDRFEIDSK